MVSPVSVESTEPITETINPQDVTIDMSPVCHAGHVASSALRLAASSRYAATELLFTSRLDALLNDMRAIDIGVDEARASKVTERRNQTERLPHKPHKASAIHASSTASCIVTFPGLAQLVSRVVERSPLDVRRALLRGIFLAGRWALLPGLAERLQVELAALVNNPAVKVEVLSSSFPYLLLFRT